MSSLFMTVAIYQGWKQITSVNSLDPLRPQSNPDVTHFCDSHAEVFFLNLMQNDIE